MIRLFWISDSFEKLEYAVGGAATAMVPAATTVAAKRPIACLILMGILRWHFSEFRGICSVEIDFLPWAAQVPMEGRSSGFVRGERGRGRGCTGGGVCQRIVVLCVGEAEGDEGFAAEGGVGGGDEDGDGGEDGDDGRGAVPDGEVVGDGEVGEEDVGVDARRSSQHEAVAG